MFFKSMKREQWLTEALFVIGKVRFPDIRAREGWGKGCSFVGGRKLFSVLTAEVLQPLWTGILGARWAPHASAIMFASPLPLL